MGCMTLVCVLILFYCWQLCLMEVSVYIIAHMYLGLVIPHFIISTDWIVCHYFIENNFKRLTRYIILANQVV